MISNSQIKARARVNMISSYAFLMFVSIVYGTLSFIAAAVVDTLSMLPQKNAAGTVLSLVLSFAAFVFVTILQTGFSFISLNIVRTGRAKLRDLFLGFRYHPGRLVCLCLIKGLIRYVCMLPVIILSIAFLYSGTHVRLFGRTIRSGWEFALFSAACIVLSVVLLVAFDLLFSQSLYLFIDHQQMDAAGCLKESCRLMRKNRMRLFLLNLSLIGYWMLVILSFGIAIICVKPYSDLSNATFYVELSGQHDPYGA